MNAYQEAKTTLERLYDDPSTPTWARDIIHKVVFHKVDPVDIANVLAVLTPIVERYADELTAHTARITSQLERVRIVQESQKS